MSSHYFQIRDHGYAEYEDGREQQRWLIDEELLLFNTLRMKLWDSPGKIVDWHDLILEARLKGPIEDMPWTGAMRPVVSERLAGILAEEAKDDVQLLPVQIQRRGKSISKTRFYVANFLRIIECMCLNESQVFSLDEDSGYYSFIEPVVDTKRIPDDVSIFVAAESPLIWIITDRLKDRFERDKIAGPQIRILQECTCA